MMFISKSILITLLLFVFSAMAVVPFASDISVGSKPIVEQRHPHPHVDPRQPVHKKIAGTNPPVFAWKPLEAATEYNLLVCRDIQFADTALYVKKLEDSVYLPYRAFSPGRYYWKWGTTEAFSSTFYFDVPEDAVVLEVSPVSDWLQQFPRAHPRIYIRPEEIKALRASRFDERSTQWQLLKHQADSLLQHSHEIEEPPFLPDKDRDYQKWFNAFFDAMWESRNFVKGAETLALAYLSSGNKAYGRAACRRMASVSTWDPYGSTYIEHNDEPHMSVLWNGPQTCDWVWDLFTAAERDLVIEQFYQRSKITYEHLHDRGSFGVTRFDSHSGREIVFLAMSALVFHEHMPEAKQWLQWLRPVLCGIWPIWGGEDGAWAEGPSYATAYVTIMTMFASALKRGTGIDLYRRPFWKGHARWRQYCWPPYAEWVGFGDHTERWKRNWNRNANLVELIALETGLTNIKSYIDAFRRQAQKSPQTPQVRNLPGLMSQKYLFSGEKVLPNASQSLDMMQVFPAAGWAAVRTHFQEPQKDIAFIFRSSPYGAISHSHASNNDFIIHVGGKVMLMPSGYYSGYGSGHHAHWVWHTKAHNCVTLSDAPQLLRSHDSRGAVIHPFEDDNLIYMQGNADPSYQTRAERCRRHVIFFKDHHCFLLIDEFVAKQGILSSLQWNAHSWSDFDVDEKENRFTIERQGNRLHGYFLYHQNAFFTQSKGWNPPPAEVKQVRDQWKMQYHLQFTPEKYRDRYNLGVLLIPNRGKVTLPVVKTTRQQDSEICYLNDDFILVSPNDRIEYESIQLPGLAFLNINGDAYCITTEGIKMVGL